MHQILRLRPAGLIWLTFAALPALHADVTLHYRTVVDLNPNLPPQITQQVMKSMDVNLPKDQTMQLKKGKWFYSGGTITSIADLNRKEITLLDASGKRYATIPADRYGDDLARAMPAVSDQAKAAMAAMKGHSEAKATGRTETIQGVEAEEHEITVTIDTPAGANMPAMGSGPMMRMVMHVWTPKAGEAARVPAIGELAQYDIFSMAGLDPVSSMSKALGQMPGFSDAFLGMMKEVKATGSPVILRMQMEMYLPMMAAMMKAMSGGGNGSAFDPDAPLAHVTYEVASISTEPVADSVFEIPAGYHAAEATDILKDQIQQRMPAAR